MENTVGRVNCELDATGDASQNNLGSVVVEIAEDNISHRQFKYPLARFHLLLDLNEQDPSRRW